MDYEGWMWNKYKKNITSNRQQLKTLLTINKQYKKSPVGWQMAKENSVSNDFWSAFVDSIHIFDCHQVWI